MKSFFLALITLTLAGDPFDNPPTEGFPQEAPKLDVFTNPADYSLFSTGARTSQTPTEIYIRHIAPHVLTRIAKYRNHRSSSFNTKQNKLFEDTVQTIKQRDYGRLPDLGKRCMKLFTLKQCTDIYSSYDSMYDLFSPMRADEEPCNCSRTSDTCGWGSECTMFRAAHCPRYSACGVLGMYPCSGYCVPQGGLRDPPVLQGFHNQMDDEIMGNI